MDPPPPGSGIPPASTAGCEMVLQSSENRPQKGFLLSAIERSYGIEISGPTSSFLGGSLSPLPQMPNFEYLARVSVRRELPWNAILGCAPATLARHGSSGLFVENVTPRRITHARQNLLPPPPNSQSSPDHGESPYGSGEKRHLTPTGSEISVGGKFQRLEDPPSPPAAGRGC